MAHSDANVSGSIILASVVLKLALYGFIRIIIGIFFLGTIKLTPFFLGFCSVSVLYSSFTTIRQFDLKVLVAYSSIAVRQKAFIIYKFYHKILLLSLKSTDNQLRFRGKPEIEHSMLGKRFNKDEADSLNSKSVMFSMIRPILVKVQNLFASTRGLQLICVKLCIKCMYLLSDEIHKMTVYRSWESILIKGLSEQSKENKNIKGTLGLPKESNFYGNRDPIVLKQPIIHKIKKKFYFIDTFTRLYNNNSVFPFNFPIHIHKYRNWRINRQIIGRGSVYIIGSIRKYSSGATDKILDKLADLNKRSILYPDKVIDRNLYADFILNKDMFLIAYDKLKSKPGNRTPGINPETLDGLNLDIIEGIISKLRDESFQFSPGRKTYIPKKKGGTRGLIVGNPRDKLVQEVMRLVLEAIYEPLFKDESHGFRINRSCHSALRYVFTNFIGVTWCIEGDISKCFDNIDHQRLMKLVSDKIKDNRFCRLLWKAIRNGCFEFKVYKNNIVGTPQGSIISPILANIYLDQLDNFIVRLKWEFDKGVSAKPNPVHRNLTYK